MSNEQCENQVSDLSEKDKLGIYARYHGMAFQLIKQATHLENRRHDPDSRKSILNALAQKSIENYEASQSENPDFFKTNFYTEIEFARKQDRVAVIKSDIFFLACAATTLERLLEKDPRLNVNNQSVSVSEPADTVMPDEIPGSRNTADEKELKDFQKYTRANVERCIKGLHLCERIIGEEIDTMKPRTAEVIREPMQVIGKEFTFSWASILATPIIKKINESRDKGHKLSHSECGSIHTQMNIVTTYRHNFDFIAKSKAPEGKVKDRPISADAPKTPA